MTVVSVSMPESLLDRIDEFAEDHGYGKKEGLSHKEVFEGLHRVGISTTGAWMVGFDFQTRENIEEDLQDFIDEYLRAIASGNAKASDGE